MAKRKTYRCVDKNGDEHFRQTESRHYEYAIVVHPKSGGPAWTSWSARKDLAEKEARRYLGNSRDVEVVKAELVNG
ncbi:MAG TPA: hypothetical protein VHT52_23975 [Stellaceae bacterium]|jgi:hypothetical protein|nr:hypothetical protein [Stellaceae bacterium]